MTTYLGVDVGFKHFGLALADGPLARPLPPLLHHSLAATVTRLLALADDHAVNAIVLGLPEGKVATLVRSLRDSLSRLSPLPVILHPETLSTKEALVKLRQVGAKRAKLRANDSYAACLILEDYLESISHS